MSKKKATAKPAKSDPPKGEADLSVTSCSAPSITISGVTFKADQIKSAVVTIDGRDVHIGEKSEDEKRIGFS